MITINSWQYSLTFYYDLFFRIIVPSSCMSVFLNTRFSLFPPSAIIENSESIESICSGRIAPPSSFQCHSNPVSFVKI